MTERELRRLIVSDRLTERQLARLSNAELAELRRILLGALASDLAAGLGIEALAASGRPIDASVTQGRQRLYTST